MSEEASEIAGKKTPSWPARIKISLLNETMKNWAAVLMGVAALATAFGSYINPSSGSDLVVLKIGYENLRQEIRDIDREVAKLNNSMNYLYRIRELEEHKRRAAEELQRTNEIVEDTYLEKYLTSKFGKKYALEYMARRQKIREEIRREYDVYPDGGLKPPKVDEPTFNVPTLDDLKKRDNK